MTRANFSESFDKRDPEFIRSMMPAWEWISKYYFRSKSSGWHNIPEEKCLVVGSHNGGLSSPDLGLFMYDWFKRFGTDRAIHGLMHPMMWKGLTAMAKSAEKFGAVPAHPKYAFEAFKRDASVLVFPGGGNDVYRPFHKWHEIHFAERRGFIKLALKEGVPIVPFVSVGAHHTLYVLGDYAPIINELIKKGMPWPDGIPVDTMPLYIGAPGGLSFGPMPGIPFSREIHYKLGKPIILDENYEPGKRYSREFVEECYQLVSSTMQKELDELIESSPYEVKEELPEMILA